MADMSIDALKRAVGATDQLKKSDKDLKDKLENSIFSVDDGQFEDGLYKVDKMSEMVKDMKSDLEYNSIHNFLDKIAKDEQGIEIDFDAEEVAKEVSNMVTNIKDELQSNVIHGFLNKIATDTVQNIFVPNNQLNDFIDEMKKDYEAGKESNVVNSINKFLNDLISGN